MAFVNYQVMQSGWRPTRTRIFRKSFGVLDFVDESLDENDFKISFYTRTGILLGYIFTGIKETILININFTIDLRGCASGYIELSELPIFEIPTYSEVIIQHKGINIYNGYVYKPMKQGSTKNQTFKIEFFGLRKKYETIPISLNYVSINSISMSGSTATYSVSSISGVILGSKIAVRNCQSKANDGYFVVTAILSSTLIQATNPNGINQGTIGGSLAYLPLEWSQNVLVSEAFSQICRAYGLQFGIKYDPLLVEESTGLTVGGMRDHDGLTIQKAFELLEKLARGRYALGVNENGYYFFKRIETDVIKKFIVGYDLNNQAVNTNYDNIKNIINVNRSKGKGETGVGWITAASAFDSTSIAKYGSSTKDITIPEYIDDDTAQKIANAELENSKDPKDFAKLEGLKYDGLLEIGNYGVVSPFGDYAIVIDEMDSISGWTPVSISISASSSILVTGANSVFCNVLNNSYITKTYNVDTRGKKFIKFWLRSSLAGQFIELEIISTEPNSYTIDIPVQVINDWFLVEIDISAYPFHGIDSLYFNFTHIGNALVYIDEISIVKYDALHTNLSYKQAVYDLRAHDRIVNLELGLQQDGLSEYLANIQNQIDTNNLTSKDKT